MRKAPRHNSNNSNNNNSNNDLIHLIRPVPVRIETQRLYDSAAEYGLNNSQVHTALEWQRRWTTYDDHDEPQQQIILDREHGARNPSPENSHANHHDEDDDDDDAGLVMVATKRARDAGEWQPLTPAEDTDDEPVSDLSSSPRGFFAEVVSEIVRPVAIRANRLGPPAMIENEDEVPERPLSPLTLYSQGSSQGSSHPSLGGMMVSCAASAQCENELLLAREGLLQALASSGGSADDEEFQNCLKMLEYSNFNTNHHTSKGMWLTLTKPTFFGCQGFNEEGDPLYTLARMSFDMFTPGDLVCSLQGNFNQVEDVPDLARSDLVIPKNLVDEVQDRRTTLKTYNIITAFTIESTSQDAYTSTSKKRTILRPIRATMTTFGYMIPDPTIEGRNSVWITGGRMEPNAAEEDVRRWKDLFPDGIRPPHEWAVAARILAVKWLMGAQIADTADPLTGAFEYTFTRPLGGHGLAYIDTLYMDESLRIVRGHRGTIFCFARME